MSITDELREYARHLHNVWYDPRGDVYAYTTMDIAPSLDAVRLDEHVLAIADRIDAEHESACEEAHSKGMKSIWLPDPTEYIKLPVDADGIPIHEGDVMKHPACVNTAIVRGIGHNTFFTRDNHGEFYRHPAGTYVHYHTPTVEDVLREFGRGWHEQMNAPETFDIADYVERYATKLQLREDA